MANNIFDTAVVLGGCRWIVEPENPKGLAENVLANATEAKEKGKKAREKWNSEYSREIMDESLMEIFER